MVGISSRDMEDRKASRMFKIYKYMIPKRKKIFSNYSTDKTTEMNQ